MTQDEQPQAETVSGQLGVIKEDLIKLAHLIGDKAANAQLAAQDYAAHAQDKATETYAQAQEAVRRNPTLAVSMAAGAGLLLARFALKRRF